MQLLLSFLSGMFLANGIPHLVKGITGQTHMTPFKRVSSATLNVIWAFVNFFLGRWFLSISGATPGDIISMNSFTVSMMAGALFMALADAWLFSKPNARFPWHKD